MHSEDFLIQVLPSGTASEPAPGSSFVVHTRTPSGQTLVTPLHLPTREKLDRLGHAFDGSMRRDFRVSEGAEDLREVLRALGDDLFEAIFRGEVGRQLGATVGRSGRPKKLLRLLVSLPLDHPHSGMLQELPWEALWYRRNDDFLALVPGYSVVRHLDMPLGAELPPRPEVLRILALSAGELPGLPPLRVDREARALREAFGSTDHVRVDVEDAVPVGELAHLLEDRRPHVLHFMGHGDFDDGTGRGALYLPDGSGGAERVEAARLVPAFKTATWRRGKGTGEHGPGLQLVVLNACRTARAVAEAPFAGIATVLARRANVPAVLAMQYPVQDRMATVFSTELYRRLASGWDLEEAVFHARLRIDEQGSLDWVAPALFSRLPGGRLFAEESRVAAADAPGEPIHRPPQHVAPGAGPGAGRFRLRTAGLLAVALVALLLAWSSPWLEREEGTPDEIVPGETAEETVPGEPMAEETVPEETGPGEPDRRSGGDRGTEQPADPDSGLKGGSGSDPGEGEAVEDSPTFPDVELRAADPASPGSRQVRIREGQTVAVAGGFLALRFRGQGDARYVTLIHSDIHSDASANRAAMEGDQVVFDTPAGPLRVTLMIVDHDNREAVLLAPV